MVDSRPYDYDRNKKTEVCTSYFLQKILGVFVPSLNRIGIHKRFVERKLRIQKFTAIQDVINF